MSEPWTPGPWACHGALFAEIQPGETGTAYFVSHESGHRLPASKANADLIAAAPAMAEVLASLGDLPFAPYAADARALLSRIRGEA